MSVANRQLESMSIVIAKTLADENMRGWVYSKCMKKFDGVTNVLRQQLAADRSRKRYSIPQIIGETLRNAVFVCCFDCGALLFCAGGISGVIPTEKKNSLFIFGKYRILRALQIDIPFSHFPSCL